MGKLAKLLPFTLPNEEREIFLEISAIPDGYYLSIDSPYVGAVLSIVDKGLLANISESFSDREENDEVLTVKRTPLGFSYSLALGALEREERARAEFIEALEVLAALSR